jgi:hypothetical protein
MATSVSAVVAKLYTRPLTRIITRPQNPWLMSIHSALGRVNDDVRHQQVAAIGASRQPDRVVLCRMEERGRAMRNSNVFSLPETLWRFALQYLLVLQP